MELLSVPVDVPILLQLDELVDERLHHRLGAVRLVVLPRLSQGSLDNISVIVVEGHVMLEYVRGELSWDNIVDDKLAVAGKEVPALVELLDLLVVINLVVSVLDEDVALQRSRSISL